MCRDTSSIRHHRGIGRSRIDDRQDDSSRRRFIVQVSRHNPDVDPVSFCGGSFGESFFTWMHKGNAIPLEGGTARARRTIWPDYLRDDGRPAGIPSRQKKASRELGRPLKGSRIVGATVDRCQWFDAAISRPAQGSTADGHVASQLDASRTGVAQIAGRIVHVTWTRDDEYAVQFPNYSEGWVLSCKHTVRGGYLNIDNYARVLYTCSIEEILYVTLRHSAALSTPSRDSTMTPFSFIVFYRRLILSPVYMPLRLGRARNEAREYQIWNANSSRRLHRDSSDRVSSRGRDTKAATRLAFPSISAKVLTQIMTEAVPHSFTTSRMSRVVEAASLAARRKSRLRYLDIYLLPFYLATPGISPRYLNRHRRLLMIGHRGTLRNIPKRSRSRA